MKILLLGANGQLGSDIVAACGDHGGFDLEPWVRADLDVTNAGELRRRLGEISFDVLVNCTSYHKTDEVEDNATMGFAVNTHAVETMADLCAEKNARFVHFSTDYVFGGDLDAAVPYTEEAPKSPVNVYGASKAMGETLARIANPDSVIFRVASLFGIAGASGKGGNFVDTMLRLGGERDSLKVVDDQFMSPTSTADIADMLFRALENDIAAGIYHAVNSGNTTWCGFSREIFNLAGIDVEVTPCTSNEYPLRAMRPKYSALDNTRLASAIGEIRPWRPALADYLAAKLGPGG